LVQFLAGGGWDALTSFVQAEAARGLQVEAVLATPVVLAHVFRGETLWAYNEALGTSETWGPGADAALRASDIAMPVMVLVVAALCWAAREHAEDTLLLGTMALMAGLIVTHRVGSPQFVAWLAPPAVVALCLRRKPWFWAPVGALLLATAGLTGRLYPSGYMGFLGGEGVMVAVWVFRNLLVVAVFVVALVELARTGRDGWRRLAARTALAPGPVAAAGGGPAATQGEPTGAGAGGGGEREAG
jgi:hypothetical protein